MLAVNPVAGGGQGRAAGELAAASLRSAGITVDEVTAEDAAGLRARIGEALQKRALPAGQAPAALVVVGGDGMVHLGLDAVAGTPTALGVIAAGTGNDIARELGLPTGDTERAVAFVVHTLLNSTPARPLDAAKVTTASGETRWFLGVLAAGLDALVNERANGWAAIEYLPRGRIRYVLATLRELPVFRPRSYRLWLDGEELPESPSILVTVANCASYGGGMRVCPGARPDDGLLDVLTVRPMSRLRLLTLFPRLYSGTHVSHPRVRIQRARTIRIEATAMTAYADGERIGPLPVQIEAVSGAVRMLLPPS